MNILVTEHNQEVLQELKRFLEDNGHHVLVARNGEEALQRFRESVIEGVYCRLQMPGLDGLGLMQELKSHHIYVPFVIVSQNRVSNQLVQALSLGACDFVTTPLLASALQRSLHKITNLNRDSQFSLYCLDHSVLESRTLEINNDFENVNRVVSFMTRNIPSYGILDEQNLFTMNIVLGEALENAIFHGNLELSSELKSERFELFREEGIKRRGMEPYKSRRVYIHYAISRNSVKCVVRDEGKGFDYSKLPDPREPENLLKVSGRGIMLISNFMDEVFWNSRGNEITMIRYKKNELWERPLR